MESGTNSTEVKATETKKPLNGRRLYNKSMTARETYVVKFPEGHQNRAQRRANQAAIAEKIREAVALEKLRAKQKKDKEAREIRRAHKREAGRTR